MKVNETKGYRPAGFYQALADLLPSVEGKIIEDIYFMLQTYPLDVTLCDRVPAGASATKFVGLLIPRIEDIEDMRCELIKIFEKQHKIFVDSNWYEFDPLTKRRHYHLMEKATPYDAPQIKTDPRFSEIALYNFRYLDYRGFKLGPTPVDSMSGFKDENWNITHSEFDFLCITNLKTNQSITLNFSTTKLNDAYFLALANI